MTGPSLPADTATTASHGNDRRLGLYQLLDPVVHANPYPLYHRLRSEDPVHWDPFLHAWVVTRYDDVMRVLLNYSADRTPSPAQLAALGLEALGPIAQVMVRQMLYLDPPGSGRTCGRCGISRRAGRAGRWCRTSSRTSLRARTTWQ